MVWLALVGVLAQLWMPVAHAVAMVQATDTGAAAYCGPKNSALAQKLREVAPPELRVALEQSGELSSAHEDCPPCAGCGGGFAAPVLASMSWLSLPHARSTASAPLEFFPPILAAPLPARGPPSQS